MLPLQILLEGFMCYFGAQNFDFRDSSLWMLTGRNGAGKSTVFDAMRWALFGVHRGGAQGNNALVHHDASAMKVVFRFALGAETIRVTRTQTRGGKSSRQIERDRGAGFEAIATTETDIGFRDWIAQTLGLSDATFCSAMYLGQGRADALLNANPRERYEILAEIVDLSAFQRLHGAADERRVTARRAHEIAVRDDEAAPLIVEETVAAQSEIVAAARNAHAAATAHVAALDGLRPAAAQWEKWDAERQKSNEQREKLQFLIGDAAAIEAEIARLDWLERALPPLEKWRQNANRYAILEGEIADETARLQSLEAQLENARECENAASQRVNRERALLDEFNSQRNAALQTQTELAPLVQQIARLESLRGQSRQLEREIARLPADAQGRADELAARVEVLQSLSAALPGFRVFFAAREKWRAARAEISALETQLETHAPQISQAQKSLERSQSDLLDSQQKEALARDAATRALSAWEIAREARARFAEVEDEAKCTVCQQPLTPEHAALEIARLEREESKAKIADDAAQKAHKTASSAMKTREADAENARKTLDEIERAARDATRELERAQRDEKNALRDATQARDGIGEAWEIYNQVSDDGANQKRDGNRTRENESQTHSGKNYAFIAQTQARDDESHDAQSLAVENHAHCAESRAFDGDSAREASQSSGASFLESEFPARAQLDAWNAQIAGLAESKTQRDVAAQAARERADYKKQRERIELEIAPLADQFSDARAASVGEESARAKREADDVAARIEAARPRLKDAETALSRAQTELENATRAREPLAHSLAQKRGEMAIAARHLEEQRAEIAPDLQVFLGREIGELERELENWRAEKIALEKSETRARAAKLAQAQAQIRELETHTGWIEAQISTLPVASHRPVAGIDAELAGAHFERDATGQTLGNAARELDRLESAFARKTELGIERAAAETALRQLEVLTQLLGPEKLQLYLLQEAQVGIIAQSNAILDRISGGTLRLELRREDLNVQGRARAQSALDFVVFHHPGPDQKSAANAEPHAIYSAFLSGSQRFRVAVALALGIGRYAAGGQGAARLESVIIDEGFGSLDKQGRDEMVGELRNLGQELKRVILVSHQEDFAEAFPNRYLIEHNGRQARARLVSD